MIRTLSTLTALTLAAATPAKAEGLVDTLCGAGHVNQALSADDVVPNPDGFYIRSLQVQISFGDPRLVFAVGDAFHLCTRSAATPEMSTGKALLMMEEREVRYLFVPKTCPKTRVSS